jgi:hypothetical protein
MELDRILQRVAEAAKDPCLYEALEAKAACLYILSHLHHLISSSLDTDAVLRAIGQAAATLIGAPLGPSGRWMKRRKL